jgi:hypothetical protein
VTNTDEHATFTINDLSSVFADMVRQGFVPNTIRTAHWSRELTPEEVKVLYRGKHIKYTIHGNELRMKEI